MNQSQSSRQAVQDTSVASTAAPEPAKTEESTSIQTSPDEEDTMASEPVAIGGASLVCQYLPDQIQGSETYTMACHIEKPGDITQKIAKAEFFKVDRSGTLMNITVQTQNLSLHTWTLIEKAETVSFDTIQAILHAENGTTAMLTASVTSMSIARTAKFWLGGEPNNAVQNGEEEDCGEFQNLTAKQQNEATSGLTSGPLGRVNDNQCSVVQSFICKNTSATAEPKWMISRFQGSFQDYAQACPQGYKFAMPMNESETMAVSALVDQNTTAARYWLPLHDRSTEGRFNILLK